MIRDQSIDLNTEVLVDADQAIKKAIACGYPAAVWRHPNESRVTAIISIKKQTLEPVEELEDCAPGFIINPFAHHHPSVPRMMQADLLFSWETGQTRQVSYRIAPSLSSTDLEVFLNKKSTKQAPALVDKEKQEVQDFQKVVAEAIKEIRSGVLSKVVLSRYKDVDLPASFDLLSFFEEACNAYPNAFCYVAYTPEHGLWMGASPETLLSVDSEDNFETMSLAGTQRLEDRSLQDIAWTQKEIEEQAMVSRYIIDCFKKIRLREFVEVGPRTVRAGNLAHLKTTYRVEMKKVGMENLGSTMMHLLHPTSAVCGMPLQEALDFIKKEEKYDRSLYAGFLGPINIEHRIKLYVNLRCMKMLSGSKARLYAGAGITEDSVPYHEYMETEMKMNTLQKLIYR